MFAKCAVFLSLLCIKYAAAIRCYECNSMNNSMCLDLAEYDQDTLMKYLPIVNCGEGVLSAGHQGFFCRKIVQTIFHKGYESDVRVTRSCGWIRYHKDCYKADNEDHLETVCQCFTDGCNAGPRLEATAVLLTTIGVLALSFV